MVYNRTLFKLFGLVVATLMLEVFDSYEIVVDDLVGV